MASEHGDHDEAADGTRPTRGRSDSTSGHRSGSGSGGAGPDRVSEARNGAGARGGTAEAAEPQGVASEAATGVPSEAAPEVAAAVAAAEAAGPQNGETVRVDSWIWSVRLVKTRSMGATACRGGHVRVNGERVKPAHSLRVGDEVRVRHEGRERIVVVKRLIRKRVGPPVAVQCYVDNSPPPPPREAVAPAGVRDRGTGRPTKRDRREIERLRALGGPPGPAGPQASRGGPGTQGGGR